MSTTFPLPLECLQLIIQHLRTQVAHKSIAALLCVNKYVCAATLPIFYSNPFDIPPLYSRISGYEKNRDFLFDLMKLVQVLLRSLPASYSLPSSVVDDDGLVTDLLRVFYFQEQELDLKLGHDKSCTAAVVTEMTDSMNTRGQDGDNMATPSTVPPLPPKTLLPYFSYMTRITLEESSRHPVRQPFTLARHLLYHPKFQAFLNRTGRTNRYRAQDPFLRYAVPPEDEYKFFAQAVEREIRRDLAWAMCCSNAERIQTLHLPISDIGRYLTLIPRLKVLADVVFQIDNNLATSSYWDLGTSEEKECWARLKEERARHLEEMALFVQEHQRQHRNVIQTARCANDRFSVDCCPVEYQMRLFQSLPPLVRPRTLDLNNWVQFSARVSETDVSLVKNIALMGASILTYDVDRLMDQKAILPRCRSLEKIALTTSSEDIFKWAVQERKGFEDATAVSAQAVVASQQRLPLVSLKNYRVEFNYSSSGRQASDVLYAFGSTLQTIDISFRKFWLLGHAPADSDTPPSPDFKLGGFFENNCDNVDGDDSGSNRNSRRAITPSPWLRLPRLETITIDTQDTILNLHPSLLARSPKLQRISLLDQRSRYSFSDVVYWEPGQCQDMVRISLVGTPAISFHPDTLKSTPKLLFLDLTMPFSVGYSFIPDPEDFEHYEEEEEVAPGDNKDITPSSSSSYPPVPTLQRRQPMWTWDWDLPHLTDLNLTSEFAYRFEFRMLNGTPSLTSLKVNICSETGRHDRTIGMEDLIKPGFKHPILRQFIDRDRQLHRVREHLISYLPQHEERCFLQQQQEDADLSGDERLWREEFEFVHVPRLQSLFLSGIWKIDYRVLKAFFSKVCPSLKDLILPHVHGFTVPEWVKSTSESLHGLRSTSVSIPFSANVLETAGLVSGAESGETWGYERLFKLKDVPVGRLLDKEPAVYNFLYQ
ncbi:hypothetical protein BGZ89_002249 [Linnemannia elongata]|nr:hypothetical protein BGZ89_002249 [Linnemannia elongata]